MDGPADCIYPARDLCHFVLSSFFSFCYSPFGCQRPSPALKPGVHGWFLPWRRRRKTMTMKNQKIPLSIPTEKAPTNPSHLPYMLSGKPNDGVAISVAMSSVALIRAPGPLTPEVRRGKTQHPERRLTPRGRAFMTSIVQHIVEASFTRRTAKLTGR